MRVKGERPLNYDRWKTKTKSRRRTIRHHEPSLSRMVDEGFKYFWSRRRVAQFN